VLAKGRRGLGAVDGIVQILFDYHSILEISKDVSPLLGLVDESLAARARGRVAGALDLDTDRVELGRARAPGQLLDRLPGALPLGRGHVGKGEIRRRRGRPGEGGADISSRTWRRLGLGMRPPGCPGQADPTTGRALVATTSSKRHHHEIVLPSRP